MVGLEVVEWLVVAPDPEDFLNVFCLISFAFYQWICLDFICVLSRVFFGFPLHSKIIKEINECLNPELVGG